MTNKEKYTNTDDALKAFQKHKEKYKRDYTLEEWFDADDSFDDLECPICHGEYGIIRETCFPWFRCKDCNSSIERGKNDPKDTKSKFKEFIAELCKKNKKA